PDLVDELAALAAEATSRGEHDTALALLSATMLARLGGESRTLLRVGAILAASAISPAETSTNPAISLSGIAGTPRSATLARAARTILCRVTVARQLPEMAATEL